MLPSAEGKVRLSYKSNNILKYCVGGERIVLLRGFNTNTDRARRHVPNTRSQASASRAQIQQSANYAKRTIANQERFGWFLISVLSLPDSSERRGPLRRFCLPRSAVGSYPGSGLRTGTCSVEPLPTDSVSETIGLTGGQYVGSFFESVTQCRALKYCKSSVLPAIGGFSIQLIGISIWIPYTYGGRNTVSHHENIFCIRSQTMSHTVGILSSKRWASRYPTAAGWMVAVVVSDGLTTDDLRIIGGKSLRLPYSRWGATRAELPPKLQQSAFQK